MSESELRDPFAKEQQRWAVVRKFVPREDITAFEVAQILARIPMGGLRIDPQDFDKLPDDLKRHFE